MKTHPRKFEVLGAAMVAFALVASGCGRVSATQTALSSSPLGDKSATDRSYKGVLGKVSVSSGGPGSLHGRVLDVGQHGIPGAVVVIAETGQRLTTDGTGTFHASGLAEGNYTFTAMATGLAQTAPTGILVQANADTAVPDITMAPGQGPSGITSITYTADGSLGDVGQPPATLLAPLGVAARGSDVLVLDANHSGGVKTGVIRQYGTDGHFQGKFGDYTHWLGLSIMKDTVVAIAIDNQNRTWVLDGAKQLWRFKEDGGKDKQASIDVDDPTAFAIDPTAGTLYVAGGGGITKLDGEGGSPQKLANAGDAKAVAAGKDALWALVDNKAEKLSADGSMTIAFGASGCDKQDTFQDASAIAVDPRNGNVVVADRGTKNVYVYDPAGVPIGKVGQGVFLDPTSLAIDASGRVFVVDAGKKKVYKFLPTMTR